MLYAGSGTGLLRSGRCFAFLRQIFFALLILALAPLVVPSPARSDDERKQLPAPQSMNSRAMGLVATPVAGGRNCTCRYFGQDFSLGTTVCLKGPDGPRLARCAMNQNNTSWKVLEQSCPSAGLEPGSGQAAISPHTGTWSDGFSCALI